MKTLAITLIIVLTLACCQAGQAQFETTPAPAAGTSTAPSTPTVTQALGFKVNALPTATFTSAMHGCTLESDGFTAGLKVAKVNKFSLAQRNGLELGDRITSFNGRQLSTQTDFQNAVSTISPNTFSVQMGVVDVKTGNPISFQYILSTDAGLYQTNFGRLELVELRTSNPNVTALEGTLHFYSGKVSKIKGNLSANKFTGTSTLNSSAPLPFELTRNGNMFAGHVIQSKKHPFIVIKRN